MDILILVQYFYFEGAGLAHFVRQRLPRWRLLSSSEGAESASRSTSLFSFCMFGLCGFPYLLHRGSIEYPLTLRGEAFALGYLIGFISAILYIASRIPQILLNFRRKSTSGLSQWMFIAVICGNLTYALSIVLYSTDSSYLATRFPWLAGSLGTLLLDCVIFWQFRTYTSSIEPEESRSSSSV